MMKKNYGLTQYSIIHFVNTLKRFFMKKIFTCIAAVLFTSLQLLAQTQNKSVTYGNKIIRFAPLKVYDMGVGLGLSYERHLDPEQKISLILPIDLAFINTYYSNLNAPYLNHKVNSYVYFSPGIKFYPSGQRKVNYAIGANLIIGSGKGLYHSGYYDQFQNWIYREQELKHYRMGMMVNNYLNFNITNKFNIGIELGLGAIYINKFENKPNEGITGTGNVAFTMGFRI